MLYLNYLVITNLLAEVIIIIINLSSSYDLQSGSDPSIPQEMLTI